MYNYLTYLYIAKDIILGMFKIFRTKKFDKEIAKKFSNGEQKQVEHFEQRQLVNNPYVGDPLGFDFFREKRIGGGKRVYFLIYNDLKAVLMVGQSTKKTQQETIDSIKSKLTEYYEIIKETIRQHGEYDHV
mgnify:CR=1 FL=1